MIWGLDAGKGATSAEICVGYLTNLEPQIGRHENTFHVKEIEMVYQPLFWGVFFSVLQALVDIFVEFEFYHAALQMIIVVKQPHLASSHLVIYLYL